MMHYRLTIMIASGVDDGATRTFNSADQDGRVEGMHWRVSIGRREDNDLCLQNDTCISRYHAMLHWQEQRWWLEDCNSKNGTFLEENDDHTRISGIVGILPGQLFRVGRTWLRIEADDE